MASLRQLRTKIRAVRNIRQITKAMQMVAATKMRRAQEAALHARPYAKKAFSLLLHLLQYTEAEGLTGIYFGGNNQNGKKSKVVKPTALVVVTSDKGLAGSFNSAVLRLALREAQGKQVEIVAVGKKGRDFFKNRGGIIAAEFFKFSDIVTLADITPLMDWIMHAYEENRYEKIVFCSMQFVSALVQKPAAHQLLPLAKEELQEIIKSIVPKTGRYAEIAREEQLTLQQSSGQAINNQQLSYLLEPSAKAILDELVRDLIRVMVVHLIFESNASEHSARMIAMKNATENAENLMETLNLQLNKARQTAITQELAEVTTAKEALMAE